MNVDWELETVVLQEAYRPLQFNTLAGAELVVPISLGDTLVIALPAEVAPWLPTYLVRLGDPEGGLSADGQAVSVCVVRLDVAAAQLLEPVSTAAWVRDGRWPAASSLEGIEVPEERMDYRSASI